MESFHHQIQANRNPHSEHATIITFYSRFEEIQSRPSFLKSARLWKVPLSPGQELIMSYIIKFHDIIPQYLTPLSSNWESVF